MKNTANEQWEQFVEKSKQDLQSKQQDSRRCSDVCLHSALVALPSVFFLAAFLFRQFEGLAFAVWIIGGLCSLTVLTVYATTNVISHRAKEAALSFFLGDLIVVGLFVLNPV